MKVESVELSWFRGAAESAILDADSKSVVIYGPNGSGKSTFSDAIEYIIGNGKIKHLSHEYSGRRQEKGVPNTHAPTGGNSKITLNFQGDKCVKAEIAPDGRCSFTWESEDIEGTIKEWELERLILRQDEVSDFIHETKGNKYSVLLPLLGMGGMEQAASNLKKLQQYVTRNELKPKNDILEHLNKEVKPHIPEVSLKKVQDVLVNAARDYLEGALPDEPIELIEELEKSINAKRESLEPEYKRHYFLAEILKDDLSSKLNTVIEEEKAIRGRIDALLDSKITILEEASEFSRALEEDEFECPACGQYTTSEEFNKHVQSELRELMDVREARDKLKASRKGLAQSLQKTNELAEKREVSSWLDHPGQKELKEALDQLGTVDPDDWDNGWPEENLTTLSEAIPVIISSIQASTKTAPPSIKKITDDLERIKASKKALDIISLNDKISKIEGLINILSDYENGIRAKIRAKTHEIISDISSDIQTLWAKLHPYEPIEEVKLYLPVADKSIDIGLKFYGVEQESPRLTLSEGHRNSLGLCIFLALAKSEGSEDRPIFLDDIISSLDREHRGMLVDILLEDLADRQVFLFTHDREWYFELRMRLPQDDWRFKVLKPWESPDVGLQWSGSQETFDDAKALLPINTESAGNCVRRIMDTNLAIAAEHLRIPMPYLRGDRNDHRTCVDFLRRIKSDAYPRLRKRDNGDMVVYTDPVSDWDEAITLLIPWANRASHTGTLTGGEVNRLIEVCEKALGHFTCDCCNRYIWTADQAASKRLRCDCGEMQWRYG